MLVDANIPIYAVDRGSARHDRARAWWEERLSGRDRVFLCWPVISRFLRISTHPRALKNPLSMRDACRMVQEWLDQPCVRIAQPGRRHWEILHRLLKKSDAHGDRVSDAHLAALAMEHACALCSCDADFARFPGLDWNDPLADPAQP